MPVAVFTAAAAFTAASADDARWLYWNSAALSYLVEILLALTLAAFLLQLVFRELRQRHSYGPTILLALLNLCLILVLITTLARTLVASGWIGYAMPWADPNNWLVLAMPWAVPAGGCAIGILVLFCYVFPQPLPQSQNERRALGIVIAAIIVAECVAAMKADIALLDREAWWRPAWFGMWMSVVVAWAIVVQWRQLARSFAGSQATIMDSGHRRPGPLVRAITSIWRKPVNREGAASRGLMMIFTLPVLHTLGLFLATDGEITGYPVDLFMCWSALFILTGFTLIFVGYLPERSSFLFKLTIIGLALAFAAVSGTAWIVGQAFEHQYRPLGLPTSGHSLRFVPSGAASYHVGAISSPAPLAGGAMVPAKGMALELPFDLPFYGRNYRRIYIDNQGNIGFENVPGPRNAAFAGGAQPAVFPLLVQSAKSAQKVTVRVARDYAVVSRSDQCSAEANDRCYSYQTVLNANGSIEIHFAHVAASPRYRVFDPLAAPWITGLVPGWRAMEHGGATPVIRDYYREFLGAMDNIIAPVVQFTLIITATVLIGLRILFSGFLVEPLNRLLAGMRRFREGDLNHPVPVQFNDEIGYLTESFNEMARAQGELVDTLEQRVAARTAEVATFAARSAQLEERTRIASDLHDTVSQTMFSAAMLADRYAREAAVEQREDEGFRRLAHLNRLALNEMRLLLVAAKDGVVSGDDTADRIKEIAAQFESNGSPTIATDVFGRGTLAADVAHAFCQIAREALNNIVKHSRARNVEISAKFSTNEASMLIADDGIGFDPSVVKAQSLGLQIMHDRARQVNAVLDVSKRDEFGMTITLAWRKADRE